MSSVVKELVSTTTTQVAKEAAEAAAKSAAKEAAEAAAKSAAKEAAEAAAKNAAKEAIEAAAKKAAKEAAEAAAKNAAKEAAEVAAKKAAKEAAEAAAKKSAKEAAEAAAKKAAKEAAEESAQTAASKSASFLKNSAGLKKGLSKRVLQSASDAAKSMGRFVAKHPKLVIGGLVGAALGAYILNRFKKVNDKQYSIIKISQIYEGFLITTKYLRVEMNMGNDKLLAGDVAVIENSNSIEDADGAYEIVRVEKNVLILNSEKLPNITKDGTAGTLTYKTTFEKQLGNFINETGGAAASAFGNFFQGVLGENAMYYIIGFIFIIIFGGSFFYFRSSSPQVIVLDKKDFLPQEESATETTS